MSAPPRIDLPFVLKALQRHRGRSILFILSVMALVIAGVLLVPREYSSEARLFLRPGRESVALDPTATIGEKISLNDTRLAEINSALEMLRSRELCARVVEELGPDIFLDPAPAASGGAETAIVQAESSSFKAAWASLVKNLEAIGVLDPVDRQERAILALGKAMSASVPRNTHLIAVSCRSTTPENAQKIVETIVACYSELHLQAHRTSQSHDFFIEQSDTLQNQIRQHAEALSKRKNELGFVTLQGQRSLLESERANVEQQLIEASGQLAASKAKLSSLETSLKDLPQHQLTEKVDTPNLANDGMRSLLYQLEIQERESAALLAETHPKLISIRQQLKGVKEILAAQDATRLQTTTGLNPSRQPLHVAQLMEKSESDSLAAKVDSLRAEDRRIVAAMQKFNEQQIEIERLERDLALADADYRSYATRREQARIDRVLADQQISNLNVVQSPTLIRKPTSPKKLLTVILGFIGALVGAVCLAVLSACLDRSFHTAEELEGSLAIPVLLSVPEFEAANRPRSLAEMEEASDHATA
jgi:polysaccharide biosynthesis protein PslE